MWPEPGLLETEAGNDRRDVSARGLWSKYERTFFDVKVMHHTADSNMQKSLPAFYAKGEAEKKRNTTTEL